MASFVTLATSGTVIHMPEPNTGEEREVLRFPLPDSGSFRLGWPST